MFPMITYMKIFQQLSIVGPHIGHCYTLEYSEPVSMNSIDAAVDLKTNTDLNIYIHRKGN